MSNSGLPFRPCVMMLTAILTTASLSPLTLAFSPLLQTYSPSDIGPARIFADDSFEAYSYNLRCQKNACWNVTWDFNDLTSSIIVYNANTCYFYVDEGCSEANLALNPGTYGTIPPEFNDAISSYKCF
ncbi:hypothetical protein DL96DRAFT_1780744 [Flagelloscypha sp. PMI_526]|nr:hypothetical protein DL96DRAFT_1780744 [Flagelloscypha sp. PMI_526]